MTSYPIEIRDFRIAGVGAEKLKMIRVRDERQGDRSGDEELPNVICRRWMASLITNL